MDLSVSVSSDLIRYIENEVNSGRFTSSSDIVEAALRLLQAQGKDVEGTLESLQAAWTEGMESGDFQPLDFSELKAEGRRWLAGK